MKLEIKTLVYSMINNLIISIIKMIGGIIFNLGSLFADGMHTFSDFITDIVCLIGAKISKRKPTKNHPYGFGKVEYLTNLFIGIVLLILSFYIIISSFLKKTVIPPLSVLILLLIVFILKFIAIYVMNKIGVKIHSQILTTSVRESKADLYSTIGVFIITILLQFSNKFSGFRYADTIGTILIGLIIFKSAISIIIDNSLLLIGEVEDNEDEKNKVKELILKHKAVKELDITLIKYGFYYKLQLILKLNPKLNLKQVTKIENKIKQDIIRHRSLKIKYVSINVTDNIDEVKIIKTKK